MPIDEVKKDHILKIIDDVLERGAGIMANRTLMRLSRFFNWCIERNLIEFSPFINYPNPRKSVHVIEFWRTSRSKKFYKWQQQQTTHSAH